MAVAAEVALGACARRCLKVVSQGLRSHFSCPLPLVAEGRKELEMVPLGCGRVADVESVVEVEGGGSAVDNAVELAIVDSGPDADVDGPGATEDDAASGEEA